MDSIHVLAVDAEGVQHITHPEPDEQDCDFETYVAQDWANASGTWGFIHQFHPEGSPAAVKQPQGYWNGRLTTG